MYTYVYPYAYIYIYVYMQMFICMYIYIYTYTYVADSVNLRMFGSMQTGAPIIFFVLFENREVHLEDQEKTRPITVFSYHECF